MNTTSRFVAVMIACVSGLGTLHAATPVFEIEIREHLFYPAELTIPAGQKVKLLVLNQDTTPEEFESFELNREKVIKGKRKAVIFIGPLAPGRYPYFGEFHPETAQGLIIAE
jgi:plastocyanin